MTGAQFVVAEATVAGYLLAVARLAGFVLVAPPFNTRGIPGRARVVLVISVALPVSAVTAGSAPALGSAVFPVQAVVEIVAGLALGFLVQVAVAVMQAVGDILDLVGGFSMSTAMDPVLFVQSSVMGRVHQLLGLALLFATDAHLVIQQGLFRGSQAISLSGLDTAGLARSVTALLADMVLAAAQVAGPIVVVVLVADVALGLLTRVAPALNAFSLGFPLKIVLTLLLAGFVFIQLPPVLGNAVRQATDVMLSLAGGG